MLTLVGRDVKNEKNNNMSYSDVHKSNQSANMIDLTSRTDSSHNLVAEKMGWLVQESNGWFRGEFRA